MPRYKLIVLTGPLEGREAEYHDWYQNIHLRQVVAMDGFKSAQRFRLTKSLAEHETFPYLAIYDVETDDIQAVLDEMNRLAGTERLSITDALAPKAYAVMYEEFGPLVTSLSGG